MQSPDYHTLIMCLYSPFRCSVPPSSTVLGQDSLHFYLHIYLLSSVAHLAHRCCFSADPPGPERFIEDKMEAENAYKMLVVILIIIIIIIIIISINKPRRQGNHIVESTSTN